LLGLKNRKLIIIKQKLAIYAQMRLKSRLFNSVGSSLKYVSNAGEGIQFLLNVAGSAEVVSLG
jgi:hypothetical protein